MIVRSIDFSLCTLAVACEKRHESEGTHRLKSMLRLCTFGSGVKKVGTALRRCGAVPDERKLRS